MLVDRNAVALDKDAESRSALLFEHGCNLMDGQAKNIKEAARMWELAMEANPKRLESCFNLALAKFGFGEFEESERIFLHAQSLDPENSGKIAPKAASLPGRILVQINSNQEECRCISGINSENFEKTHLLLSTRLPSLPCRDFIPSRTSRRGAL